MLEDSMSFKRAIPVMFLLLVSFLVFVPLGHSIQQTAGELFEKALYLEEAQGDLQRAIELYRDIIKRFPDNRVISAKTILHIGFCYEKLGLKQAQEAYQQVVDEFPEQVEAVKVAREKLSLIDNLEKSAPAIEDLSVRKVMEGWGKVSPDGNYLVSPNYQTGNLSLFDVNSGKKREIKLGARTKGENVEMIGFATWAPDSRALAYSWNVNQKHDLRLIDLDGGEPRILYQSADLDYIVPLDWSLDGKNILMGVSGKIESRGFAVFSLPDNNIELLNLKNAGLNHESVRIHGFSPDGKSLLVTNLNSQQSVHDILLYSISEERVIPLIEGPADDRALGWTKDGKDLIFLSDRTGGQDLWVAKVAHNKVIGHPILVKRQIGAINSSGVTHDGAFFYQIRTGFVDVSISKIDLKLRKVLSEPKKIVKRYVGANTWPAWSHDGSKLLYISDRKQSPGEAGSNSNILCIHDVASNETKELRPALKYIRYGIWAPDGKSLLLVGGDDESDRSLYKVSTLNGETSLFRKYDDGTGIQSPVFTKDNSKIFFRCFKWNHLYEERKYEIKSYELDTQKEEILLTTKPETAAYLYELALSPDETQLSFFTQSLKPICTILYIMPAGGGEPKEILRYKLPDLIVQHCWTPDGNGLILAVGNLNSGATRFLKVSLKDSNAQDLGLNVDYLQRFSLHPDGKTIAFSSGKTAWETWALENFLPNDGIK
jgi:Tol biopolymer transport system component